jgi:mannose-1-phosphate guanylyltransferase/mannose-1-phosphate guanylyltransferase/phosphomannomutase
MAAGAGTRLDPLTKTVPKPMIPVANIPIIELILNHLKNYGIKDVVANTHYLANFIHERFENNNLGINFNYVYEPKLSGTAGGVKKCEWFFDPGETFIVVSGDALTDINIDDLIERHKSSGAFATMALKEIPISEVSHFGVVVVDDKERIIGFQEKPEVAEAKSNLVNTGIYVFERDIFNYIPENTFYDFAKNVFPHLMVDKKLLCGHVVKKYWSDIGTLNQYRMSSFDILESKVDIKLPYKVTSDGWFSDSCKISSDCSFNGNKSIIGDNTIIKDKVEFFGNSIIGSNCIIEEGAHIKNSIIWDNVTVKEGARLDGCIVANNATIGKNTLVFPGCVIPDNYNIPENMKFKKITK